MLTSLLIFGCFSTLGMARADGVPVLRFLWKMISICFSPSILLKKIYFEKIFFLLEIFLIWTFWKNIFFHFQKSPKPIFSKIAFLSFWTIFGTGKRARKWGSTARIPLKNDFQVLRLGYIAQTNLFWKNNFFDRKFFDLKILAKNIT